MKTWTKTEIAYVAKTITPLVGLRLQEVLTSAQDVVLGFYASPGLLWLWVDLNALWPCLLPWSALPFKPLVVKTPLQLFLRAHFVGRTLAEIRGPSPSERVFYLRFGQTEVEGEPELELRLFPHGRNLIASAGRRRLAWAKPKAIATQEASDSASPARGLEQLREDWLRWRERPGALSTKQDPKMRVQKDLAKKLNARKKVQEEVQRKMDLPWRQIGDWLKAEQSLAVPVEWQPFIDKRRKLAWNIEQCYTKAREVEGKAQGTRKRLEVLDGEIEKLKQVLEGPKSALIELTQTHRPAPRPKNVEASGRTLHLSQEITVMAGKSAADNMKILRKARAWDLWFHLADSPSSHAVLFRNKNTQVSDAMLHQVGEWLIRTSLGQKAKAHYNEKFTVMVTEVRFVSPIRGDKIGRVTYRNERTFVCTLNP